LESSIFKQIRRNFKTDRKPPAFSGSAKKSSRKTPRSAPQIGNTNKFWRLALILSWVVDKLLLDLLQLISRTLRDWSRNFLKSKTC